MPLAPSLPPARAGCEQKSCQHELTLKRLEPDLDTMRQLITCKICQRFLSEPYGLACGHTYCYVCLDAWLVAQKKRTCPDCRATIKEQPVPSYLIREMTRVFAYRQELLPDGETVEEHDEYIKEAVSKVSTDKDAGGLFSGLFKGGRMHWMPMHDPGDDVDRCPNCHWELEEGRCNSCGLNIGDEDGFGLDTGESENSDDDDDELDNDVVPHDYDGMDDPGSFDEDDYLDEDGNQRFADEEGSVDLDIFGPMPLPTAAHRRSRHRRNQMNLDSEPESEDSEDPDNDPLMEGFLDNEAIEESGSDSSREQSDSEEEAEETPRHTHRQIIRPTIIHDSDSDDAPRQPRRPVVVEDSSDEEGPVARNNQRAGKVSRGTRRTPVVQTISSDEETSPDNSEDDNSDSDSSSGSDNGGVNAGAFSPMQSSVGEGSRVNDGFAHGPYGYDDVVPSDEEAHFADYVSPDDEDDDGEIDYGGYGNDYGGDYGNGYSDGEDDGVRSTTAGSAPFPSLAAYSNSR